MNISFIALILLATSAFAGTPYLVNGNPTTLSANGCGIWNGIEYYCGKPLTGTVFTASPDTHSIFYIEGVATTLNPQGSGVWNNVAYIEGFSTPLDLAGNGTFQKHHYSNFTPDSFSGLALDGAYYINGVVTTLDSNGNGTWANAKDWEWWITPSYYIKGAATTLSLAGTGFWSGTPYLDGMPVTSLAIAN